MSLLSIKNKIGIPSDWKMVPIGKVLISSQYPESVSIHQRKLFASAINILKYHYKNCNIRLSVKLTRQVQR